MSFLIRMAFWFSLVLLALPLSVGTDDAGHQAVGPLQALFAAREAVGDIAGICERKPDVCETGKSAMQTITARAKETAKIAAAMLDDKQTEGQTDGQTGGKPTTGLDTTVATGSVAETIVLPATVDIPVRMQTTN
ncbi:DUF5330 domain-containing protein [Mesorhizobium helmanticense]|uniref:DUF5330 domain-containing protein n=1 Tax=Mesorhizobium helmanticense TaxID=1776423 RepID=A0A2T4IUS2_9HYPH|nr:DUF5330 domain-containing protein [Mesorhizobium helmanticense]PTE09411.1 hypothetical protein C9427_15000 [Mesorhizobium helmanticense]